MLLRIGLGLGICVGPTRCRPKRRPRKADRTRPRRCDAWGNHTSASLLNTYDGLGTRWSFVESNHTKTSDFVALFTRGQGLRSVCDRAADAKSAKSGLACSSSDFGVRTIVAQLKKNESHLIRSGRKSRLHARDRRNTGSFLRSTEAQLALGFSLFLRTRFVVSLSPLENHLTSRRCCCCLGQ